MEVFDVLVAVKVYCIYCGRVVSADLALLKPAVCDACFEVSDVADRELSDVEASFERLVVSGVSTELDGEEGD